MAFPKISIIVPVYNGEKCIGECIESLLALDYPKQCMEIIVVDNNSTDKSVEIIKKFSEVKLISEKKQGACCARNIGYRNASNDLIAFTDSDCIVDKNWLKELVRHFENDRVAGCGGHLEPMPPQTVIEEYIIFRDILSQENAFKNEPLSPPFLITSNAMYRKNILNEVGGFDENFYIAGEDADLSWRIVEKGYKLECESKAIVYHKHRSTLMSFLRQVKSYGCGTSYLFWKYHKKFGYERFIYKDPYFVILKSFIRAPYNFIFKKNKLDKYCPILDFLGEIFFLIGKISTSFKLKIKNF